MYVPHKSKKDDKKLTEITHCKKPGNTMLKYLHIKLCERISLRTFLSTGARISGKFSVVVKPTISQSLEVLPCPILVIVTQVLQSYTWVIDYKCDHCAGCWRGVGFIFDRYHDRLIMAVNVCVLQHLVPCMYVQTASYVATYGYRLLPIVAM